MYADMTIFPPEYLAIPLRHVWKSVPKALKMMFHNEIDCNINTLTDINFTLHTDEKLNKHWQLHVLDLFIFLSIINQEIT